MAGEADDGLDAFKEEGKGGGVAKKERRWKDSAQVTVKATVDATVMSRNISRK